MTHFPASDTAARRAYLFFPPHTPVSQVHPLLSFCILHWCFFHALAFVWHAWPDACWRVCTLSCWEVSSETNNANRTLVYQHVQVELTLISHITSKSQVQMPIGKVWVFLSCSCGVDFFSSCIEFQSRENSFVAKMLLLWSLRREGCQRGEWFQIYCLFQSCVVSFNTQCFYYSE